MRLEPRLESSFGKRVRVRFQDGGEDRVSGQSAGVGFQDGGLYQGQGRVSRSSSGTRVGVKFGEDSSGQVSE